MLDLNRRQASTTVLRGQQHQQQLVTSSRTPFAAKFVSPLVSALKSGNGRSSLLLATAFPAGLALPNAGNNNNSAGTESGAMLATAVEGAGSNYNFLQISGFLLIFGVVLFLIISYTCHMLSVFAPRTRLLNTVYCERLSKVVKIFSSFNTVNANKLVINNVSTPIANKRIASASRQIALAMSQITSPISESNRPNWYNSTDPNNPRQPATASYRTIEDFFSTSDTAELSLSPNTSSTPIYRLSSSGQQPQPKLSEKISLFSNNDVLLEVEAIQSSLSSSTKQQGDIDVTSLTRSRTRSNASRSRCSQPVTATTSSGTDQVSVAECHLSDSNNNNNNNNNNNELLVIANCNASTPSSPETTAVDVMSNLVDLAEDDREQDEEAFTPPQQSQQPTGRCRRTSSLPQMSTFLAVNSFRQESCSPRLTSMTGLCDSQDTASSAQTLSMSNGPAGSDYLLMPIDNSKSIAAGSSPQLNQQNNSDSTQNIQPMPPTSWTMQELPGVDNYYKHHQKLIRPTSCHSPTSPPTMGSPTTSANDVFRMKQQQYIARKATTKRFKKSNNVGSGNSKLATGEHQVGASMRHAGFISGKRIQNLL